MIYATPAWAFISKSNMKRLQVVQNRALRIIGGCDWNTGTEQIHSDNETPMLSLSIKMLVKKLYASAKLSRNRYVSQLGSNTSISNRRVPKPLGIIR